MKVVVLRFPEVAHESRQMNQSPHMWVRVLVLLMALLGGLLCAPSALAQAISTGTTTASALMGPVASDESSRDAANFNDINPLSILAGAGDAFNALTTRDPQSRSASGAQPSAPAGGLSGPMNIIILLTVITLVPSIMLMTTCFVRIIIVLGLLKQAMGTQTLPPPQVTVGLAMFMTILVMAPTIDRVHREGIVPYQTGKVRDYDDLWARVRQPIRDFMFDQIEATNNWSSVYMVLNYRGVDTSHPELLTTADVDMVTLIPAFMLSELKTGFMIGFKVYLPFLVIDMVISAILLSMGMMMLPPVLISLPFKLLLFVLVDGWTLIVGSLLQSFITHPVPGPAAVTSAFDPPVLLQLVSAFT